MKKNDLHLNIELEHFNLTFLTITASFKTLKDQKVEKLRNAMIRINSYSDNNELIIEPIVEEKFDGTFVITLDPGNYFIKIEKDGHQTIETQYFAQSGQQELDFAPVTKFIDDEPKKEMDSKTRFQNRPSSSARKGILKSTEPQQQKNNGEQVESNAGEDGQAHQNSSHQTAIVKIQENQSQNNNNTKFSNGSQNAQQISESPKQGQRPPARPTSSNPLKKSSQDNSLIQNVSSPEKITDEWSFKKIESQKQKDISQLKPPKISSEIKLTGLCKNKIIEFILITPDQVNMSTSNDKIKIQNDVNESNKIGLWIQEQKKYQSGIYRIYAKILNNKQFNQNNLKVYASSSTNTTFLQIPIIDTADQDKQLYWDIVKLQKFFEINNYTSQTITRDWLLEPYQELINFLIDSRTELKKILGFDSYDKQTLDEDDVYVKKETVLKSLENYEFEGSHHIDHLLQSASNQKGYISFKKIEQKLIHKDLKSCKFVEPSASNKNGQYKYTDDEEEYQNDYDD